MLNDLKRDFRLFCYDDDASGADIDGKKTMRTIDVGFNQIFQQKSILFKMWMSKAEIRTFLEENIFGHEFSFNLLSRKSLFPLKFLVLIIVIALFGWKIFWAN